MVGSGVTVANRPNLLKYLYGNLLNIRVTPTVITIVYIITGSVLLYISDFVFPTLLEQPRLARLQVIKGSLEVLVTAGVIYLLSSRSRHQIEKQKERLQRREVQLDVLHRVLRHNLRNNMNIIDGNTSLIESKAVDGTIHSRCEDIHKTVTETLRYTEYATHIRRVDEAGTSEIDLATWIPEIVEIHPLIEDSIQVDMKIQDGLTVSVNRLFGESVDELIRNAIQHNKSEFVKIRIEAYSDPVDPGLVIIDIADNGPGISPEQWRIVQEGEENQLKHLDGLGLWFVYWTVEESGGDIEIGESEMGGCRLRIRLPGA